MIKFFVAIFKDLTFWVKKFNFKLVKTSMLFSVATNEKNYVSTRMAEVGEGGKPSLALHGLVLLGQDGAHGDRKRFRITDPFRIPVALVENREMLPIGFGPNHD